MKFKLSTNYSEEEMKFLDCHNCKILSEIRLSRTNFSENEIPRRMFIYYDTYVGEVIDDDDGSYAWAVLSKWKGVYRFTGYYGDLQALEQGL